MHRFTGCRSAWEVDSKRPLLDDLAYERRPQKINDKKNVFDSNAYMEIGNDRSTYLPTVVGWILCKVDCMGIG